LPAFLTPNPGLNSGFMIAEVTAAALMAENKQRATPCSIDSTPTSANQEDHVSMACHGARRITEMNHNLAYIVAIELLISTQGIEFRAPIETSSPLRRVMTRLRADVAPLEEDRYLADDIAAIKQMVFDRQIIAALDDSALLPNLES
jgi:histidine ammonia-lyase